MRTTAAALALLLVALSAAATSIVPGDVAADEYTDFTVPPGPAIIFDAGAHVKAAANGLTAVAFGPNGHLFGKSGNNIAEYDTSLALVRTIPWVGDVIGLAIAQNGDIYVLSRSVAGGKVTILSPAGAVKQTFPINDWLWNGTAFDLAPDQCSILFTGGGALDARRLNVCTSELTTLVHGDFYALRATADGGFVAGHDSTVSVYDANNRLVRSYALPSNVTALAFDADPRFLWVAAGGIRKIRLSDGVAVALAGHPASVLAVNGEQRAAAADLATTAVPTLSPSLLLALALGLMALAWQRLRA